MFKAFLSKHTKIHTFFKEADRLITRMEKHHIFLIAAGIAFNIFLYMIPLFLMAVYVVNLIFGIEIIASTFEKILIEIFPPTNSAGQLISDIIDEIYLINDHSSIFGWIGLIVLLWLSSTLFSSIRTGLNTIFNIPSPKIFVIYRLKDILLTIILALLILLSSYALPLITFVTNTLSNMLPELIEPMVSKLSLQIISIGTSFVMFYFLFRFVPNVRLPRFPRLISTGLSVLLIELSRNVFAWYLRNLSSYGKFYGTYAVIVSMAIWIYYFILIILISAEIGRFINELREKKKDSDENEPEAFRANGDNSQVSKP